MQTIDTDEESVVFQAGVGMDIYATDHWMIGLESKYRRPTDDFDEVLHWTFGATLMYAF